MKVRWTRRALADLDSAYEYVAGDNPAAAERMLDRIEEAVTVLGRHPEAGRTGRIHGTREVVVTGTPFLIPYRVRRSTVELLAVIHGSRKWPDSL